MKPSLLVSGCKMVVMIQIKLDSVACHNFNFCNRHLKLVCSSTSALEDVSLHEYLKYEEIVQ